MRVGGWKKQKYPARQCFCLNLDGNSYCACVHSTQRVIEWEWRPLPITELLYTQGDQYRILHSLTYRVLVGVVRKKIFWLNHIFVSCEFCAVLDVSVMHGLAAWWTTLHLWTLGYEVVHILWVIKCGDDHYRLLIIFEWYRVVTQRGWYYISHTNTYRVLVRTVRLPMAPPT